MNGGLSTARLATPRLVLTPFTPDHLTSRYVSWLNNPETMRHSEQRHRLHTFESCRAYLESYFGTPHYFWAIEETAVGLGHVGNINAYVDPPNRLADVGIVIGEAAARGKGLGLEAWTEACRFLIQKMRLRKISAGTMAANRPMLKLMQTAGMIPDGVRTAQYLLDDEPVDIVHMAFFADRHFRDIASGGSVKQ